jgi:hypothetical protein
VADKLPVVRDRYPAEPQGAARGQPVRVVPDANADSQGNTVAVA